MSDLYSDLPAASGGKGGDGVNVGSWIQRKPQQPRIQPRARTAATAAAAAAPRVGGFNPLSGRANQSPLLASSDGSTAGSGSQSVQSLQRRLAAASAKLAAKSKSILGAGDGSGSNNNNLASRNGGEGASSSSSSPKNGSDNTTAGIAGDNSSEIFSSIPDEYDPRQPNDYADYCERRLAQKKKDLAKRDLERQVRKLEEERRRAKEDDAKQGYSALRSAVEAARAGGRGRGRALTVPAWMVKKEEAGPGGAASKTTSMKMPPPPPSFHASSSSASASSSSSSSGAVKMEPGQFDDADSSGNPDFGGSSLNKAARMMSRMGYQKGRGLGAKEDGIASALVHESTGRGMGKLVAGAPPRPPGFFAKMKSEGVEGGSTSTGGAGAAGRGGRGRGMGMAPPPPPPSGGLGSARPPMKRLKTGVKNPSPVVLLRNMVGPGEVDDALEGEIQGECTKFGGVVKVMIFEVKNLEAARCPKEGAVRIFVEFQSLAGAMKAVQDLDGRFFAKRRISAVFFPKARFEALDLQPKPSEPPLQV